MVCIPCIVYPVLLFIWFKFIQPIARKIMGSFRTQPQVTAGPTEASGIDNSKEASCPFSSTKKTEMEESPKVVPVLDKKND